VRKVTKMKLRRVALGYTQWDVAKATDIPQHRISQLERGITEFREDEAKKLSEFLGMPIKELQQEPEI